MKAQAAPLFLSLLSLLIGCTTTTSAPMATPTSLPTDMPVFTDTPAFLPTDTPMPTATFTVLPTDTLTPKPPSPTPSSTCTPMPTDTLTPTETLKPTDTPEPTLTDTPEPTDTPRPTDTPVSYPAVGLGVTRADAARLYQLFEFTFELETDEKGQAHYVGTVSDDLAIVELIGPEGDITSAFVVINVPKPPDENQASRTIAYLAMLLTVAAEDWEEGTEWLNQSLNNMGESRTTYANREIVLVITPQDDVTNVEFTISAK